MPNVEAADRNRLAAVIYEEAKAASLDPFFVLALIAVESGFDHVAESERGARGLMQLRPSTLRSEAERSRLGADLDDPVLNVRAGIRYLRRLVQAFGSTDVALMAYNAGPNRILRYLQDEGAIPERFLVYPEKVNGELKRLRRQQPLSSHPPPQPEAQPQGPVALGPAAKSPDAEPDRAPGRRGAAASAAR
jgi:soluble lytic murein transglycosylase-like protein